MSTRTPGRSDPQATAFPSRLPLVGRRDELAALLDILRRPRSGPAVTIVSGEGGVGKSRLVETVAQRAADQGWRVAAGRAFPVEAGVPWALFSDAFLPVLRELEPGTLTVLSRGGERELAYLFPALGHWEPAVQATSDAEEFRTRILWNFAEFLRSFAERTPLLVVLEDLQWADTSSLQLLHFLARQASDGPVAYLCTYNETERDHSPALIRTERSLASLHLATTRHVDPLSHADTLELVCRTFGVDESVVREFSALLYGWTRGNAFFLEETLKALVAAGKLHSRDGTWLGWEVREPALPRSVRDAVLERLSRLPDDAAAVAEHIAAIGSRARFRPLASVAGLDDRRLLAALEVLCEQRFLLETTDGSDVVYDFVHPLVRDSLYGEMGLARARIAHGEIAEALETHYGPAAIDHADELAYHFARSDARHLASKAVQYLAAAGRAALARRADREAVEYLRKALDRAREPGFEADAPDKPDAPDDAGLSEGALLNDLARAHHHLGEYEEARRTWEEALKPDMPAGSRARMERYMGLAAFWNGEPEAALAALDRAGEAAAQADLPRAVARVRLFRGIVYQEAGRPDEARAEIGRALDTASALDDRALLARVHRSLALVNIWTGRPGDVYDHGERAIELAEEGGDRQVAFWSHWAIAVARGLCGDTGEMARRLDIAREIAQELRSPVLELWTAEMTIEHHFATGEWESGIALGEKAIALARSLNQRMLLPRLLVWTSSLYLGRGDLERGKVLVDEAARVAGLGNEARLHSVHALVPAYIGKAHHHLAAGEYQKAVQIGEEGLEVAEGTGYLVWALHRLLPVVAEAYLWLEDTEGARRTGARMRELAERLDHTLGLAWADACDAMVRWKEGDPEGGAVAMRGAAESLEAIPMIPAAARIRRQLAGRLADLGDREGALEELRRVHEVFVHLGADRELDKARVQFKELGSRPPPLPPGPSRAAVGSLTARQSEVARLVARGKSDKGIGNELGISYRTVSTHLTNIYKKLDLASRNELADFVREGGLAE